MFLLAVEGRSPTLHWPALGQRAFAARGMEGRLPAAHARRMHVRGSLPCGRLPAPASLAETAAAAALAAAAAAARRATAAPTRPAAARPAAAPTRPAAARPAAAALAAAAAAAA